MMEPCTACAAYFQSNPGYRRIMESLRDKYRSLGRVGGSILLRDATQEECEAARLLFGHPFVPPLKLSLAAFEAALGATRYHGVTLTALLDSYFETAVQTKKEESKQRDARYVATLVRAAAETDSERCRQWLGALRKREIGGDALLSQCIARGTADQVLRQVCGTVEWLERNVGETIRLAVLSARVTADPHALDENTPVGKLLIHALAFRAKANCPAGAEARDALYFQSGILCDSISSSVTQTGLCLLADGGEHPAFQAFRLRREICTLTLTNLAGITGARSPSGRVYLLENQMVFSQLCDHAQAFHSPLICTSGQIQVAVLRLLDLLNTAGTQFFYAGDFDVGGLSIAARLLKRYPTHMKLWHMTPKDYQLCRSEIAIDKSRLRNLEGGAAALEGLLPSLLKHGVAGYQELLLPALLQDLTLTP